MENWTVGEIALTSKGRDYVVSLGDDQYDSIISSLPPRLQEASDEEWNPLPIDRGSIEFKEMVSAVETAVNALEANNGYSAEEPSERDGIVLAIRGTLNAISSGAPSKRFVLEGLAAPLIFIARKFAETGVGELAKHAVNLVWTFFALSW